MVYMFGSTSKVSFPGSGVSAIATSLANVEFIRQHMTVQIIGHDKINQLRHVRFFKDIDGLKNHMQKHAEILRPKFEAVLQILQEELKGLEIGSWVKPRGGYFISFNAMPEDSNIRIAPSFPTPEEMAEATKIFVLCVKLASVEKLLND